MMVWLDEKTNLDGLVNEGLSKDREGANNEKKIKNREKSMPKALSWDKSGRDQGTKRM